MGYETRVKFDEYRRNNAGPMDPKLLADGLEAAQSQVARLEHVNDRYSLKIRSMKSQYRKRVAELEELVQQLQSSQLTRRPAKDKDAPARPGAAGLKKLDKAKAGGKGIVTLPQAIEKIRSSFGQGSMMSWNRHAPRSIFFG